MHYSWKDASRGAWGVSDYQSGASLPFRLEQVATGALQRIADALEKIAERLDPEWRVAKAEQLRYHRWSRAVWRPFRRRVFEAVREALGDAARGGMLNSARAAARAVAEHLCDAAAPDAVPCWPSRKSLDRELRLLGPVASWDWTELGCADSTARRMAAALRPAAPVEGD